MSNYICLKNVTLNYYIYENKLKSWKGSLKNLASAGSIIKDEKKNITLYRQMTGRAMGGLSQGMDKEQIAEILKKEWLG